MVSLVHVLLDGKFVRSKVCRVEITKLPRATLLIHLIWSPSNLPCEINTQEEDTTWINFLFSWLFTLMNLWDIFLIFMTTNTHFFWDYNKFACSCLKINIHVVFCWAHHCTLNNFCNIPNQLNFLFYNLTFIFAINCCNLFF